MALAAAVSSRAQAQPEVPRIVYVSGRALATDAHLLQAFRDGLKAEGYVDGQNVRIEAHWLDGHSEPMPALLAEQIKSKPRLIVSVGSSAATVGAKAAVAGTVPVVFVVGIDPVAMGLVSNLARPDTNMTGMVLQSSSLEGKRIDLLREMLPAARSLALLVNPTLPDVADLIRDAERTTTALGLRLQIVKAQSETEIDSVLAALPTDVDGLAVGTDGFITGQRARLLAFAKSRRLPAIFPAREFADDGGLASYGARLADAYRGAGSYAGRVLKGVPPKELPIQQPTSYELVVNLKTAKSLGFAPPPTFLVRADEVIE